MRILPELVEHRQVGAMFKERYDFEKHHFEDAAVDWRVAHHDLNTNPEELAYQNELVLGYKDTGLGIRVNMQRYYTTENEWDEEYMDKAADLCIKDFSSDGMSVTRAMVWIAEAMVEYKAIDENGQVINPDVLRELAEEVTKDKRLKSEDTISALYRIIPEGMEPVADCIAGPNTIDLTCGFGNPEHEDGWATITVGVTVKLDDYADAHRDDVTGMVEEPSEEFNAVATLLGWAVAQQLSFISKHYKDTREEEE